MKTILIIDDDLYVGETIQDVLEGHGYHALVANSGKTGLDLAIQQQPDLILCDVQMPGMDGYAVLSSLRQIPTLQATPFIFLTAQSEQLSVRQGMNLGADDYLVKPSSTEELLKALNSRLARQAMFQSQTQQRLDMLRSSIAMSLPHEFRTPLTGIFTAAGLLRLVVEGSDVEAEVLDVVTTIESSANRLNDLIQRYLLYAKLEVTNYNSDLRQALSQNEVIFEPDQVVRTLATEIAAGSDRTGDLHLEVNNATIAISWFHLEKILQELVDNAFKFSSAGTPVYVRGMAQADHYEIQISNQGRGMTAEQIANLGGYIQFDRNVYEQQGVGLGLAIARRLTQLHGGQLSITSIPGQVTTVSVGLPLAE